MWRTKDDVLKDLAECTGVPLNELDDDYIVRGCRPPPPARINDIDDVEYNLRFGGCGDHLPKCEGPDLSGITKMLRMVDTFDTPPDTYSSPRITRLTSPRSKRGPESTIVISKPERTPSNQRKCASPRTKNPDTSDRPSDTYSSPSITRSISSRSKRGPENISVINKPERTSSNQLKCASPKTENPEDQIIVKSKLNPFVSEFVPKSFTTKNTSKNEHKIADNNKMSSPKNGLTDKHMGSHNIIEPNIVRAETNTENVESKACFVANNAAGNKEDTERQKMVALLKSKITANCKDNTVEKKRDKNVALAALLRLNSGHPVTTPNTTSSGSTPKCSSPFLDTSKPPESELQDKKEIAAPFVLFTPDYYAGPSRSPKMVDVDDSELTIPEPKPLLEAPLKTPSPEQLHDPEIKQSIDKVNNWLNPQKKDTAMTVSPHIGPVTFIKKKTVSPNTPSSDSKKTEKLHVIPSFKPSRFASEFAKDLEARVKAKEAKEMEIQPPVDIWTKLELDLKARDKAIMNRVREGQNQNEPHTSGSSSSSSVLR